MRFVLLNDPTQVLMPAVRRMKADFVVLEENGSADFNPAAGREALEKKASQSKFLTCGDQRNRFCAVPANFSARKTSRTHYS